MLLPPAACSTNRRVHANSGGLARRHLNTAFLNNMAYEEQPALGLGLLGLFTRLAMSRAGPNSSVNIVWQPKQRKCSYNSATRSLGRAINRYTLSHGLGLLAGSLLSTERTAALTTTYPRSTLNYNIFSTTYVLIDSPFNDSVIYPCQISPLQFA